MKSLLVATDLSARSERALMRALRLATDHAADLTIAHVIDDDLPGPVILRRRKEAEEIIEATLRAWPQLPALRVQVSVAAGQGHAEILRMAKLRGVDLIVTGMHRHTGVSDLFRGSTIGRIVGYAEAAVMVVRDAAGRAYGNALVAMDFTPPAEAALAFALDLVPAGKVTALHVHEDAAPEGFKARSAKLLAGFGASPDRVAFVARQGAVREVLAAEIAARAPDVVVAGTRGLRGVERAFRGSVALDLLGEAPCDVVAVPGD